MAHSLNLAGGVNLPLRTRINANLAWGLHLQNDSFLPHTINPAIAGDPSLALPSHSLNGLVQTWLVYLNATSRPFDIVTFGARYRFYDYSDESRKITFPGVVLDDNALEPSRSAGRWSFQKQNFDVDARTRFLQMFALTTGVGWERWDRNEHREVPVSDEFFAKAALDATPTDWLLARVSYVPSFRRISNYNTRAHAEHSVLEDPAAALQGQSVLLRKFDEAERDRQKVEGQLQFTLSDANSMIPGRSLADYDELTLVARLSKSGQPVAQPGDWEAQVGQGAITLHSDEHLATSDQGVVMLRRLLQRQLDAVAAGSDPSGVSFDPATPPVVFEAGNYILDRGDSKAAELLSG